MVSLASAGLEDLNTCLPYTLASVREIESVEYPNRLLSLQDPNDKKADGELQILSVTAADPGAFDDPQISSIAVLSTDLTTIAIPIKQTADGVRILPLSPEVPRLFCDFPLLGNETFPFPVIINNPTEPWHGVFLTKTERPLRSTTTKASSKKRSRSTSRCSNTRPKTNWQHLHFLAAVKPVPAELAQLDQNWYRTAILNPCETRSCARKSCARQRANWLPSIPPTAPTTSGFRAIPPKKSGVPFGAAARHEFPNNYQRNRTSKFGMTSFGPSATN